MNKKQKRVRARAILVGDTFRPVVAKLDDPNATKEALASTVIDVIKPRPERIIRMAEVRHLTGLSRSSVLRKADSTDDDFPSAVRLGESSRGWHLWEILDWVRERAKT